MYNRFAFVTAAKNESANIARTLSSVLNLELKPEKWILVDDGSTDGTKDIIMSYIRDNSFSELISIPASRRRDFASKVFAINEAIARINLDEYDFICNIDADVAFDRDFTLKISRAFSRNNSLGITGGVIWEKIRGTWEYVHSNPDWCVGGATQFFRLQCFKDIGGYLPLQKGGEDTICEYMARYKGWEVYAQRECRVYHHKPSLSLKRNSLKNAYRSGKQEYAWGTGTLFEFVKCISRISDYPFMAGAVIRFLGFLSCILKREPYDVGKKIALIVRSQQTRRLLRAMKKNPDPIRN